MIVGIFVFLFVFTSLVSAAEVDDRNIFEKIWDFLFNYGDGPQLSSGKALDDGLVLHLPFDGNYLDASVNGYDAIVGDAGTPVLTTGFNGVPDSAYYFDGNDLLEVPGIPVDALGGNYTISFWVNFSTFMDNVNNANGLPGSDGLLDFINILSNEDSAGSYSGFVFDGYPNTDNLYFYPVLDNDPGNDLVGGAILSGIVGNWAHIAATYDQNVLRFYVDGVEFNNNIGVASINNPINDLHIGADTRLVPERFINASLDDLRIYSRALNVTEIVESQGICNDGFISGLEVCDGANLNGESCNSQGFINDGTLSCASDCMGFVTTSCVCTEEDNDNFILEAGSSVCNATTVVTIGWQDGVHVNDCNDTNADAMELQDLYLDGDGDLHGLLDSLPTVYGVCQHYSQTNPAFMAYLIANGLSNDNVDCDDSDVDRFAFHSTFIDGDGDGYGDLPGPDICSGALLSPIYLADFAASGNVAVTGDCNDANNSIYPGATEIDDDGIDQNCDGIDSVTCSIPGPGADPSCDVLCLAVDPFCSGTYCIPIDPTYAPALDGTSCGVGGETCQAGVCTFSGVTYGNLIAHLTLDSDYNDIAGSYDGSCTSCPNQITGQLNGGYDFDGVTNSLNIGDVLVNDEITITAWVNPDFVNSCGPRIVSKASGVQTADHNWMMGICNGQIRTRIKAGGTTDTFEGGSISETDGFVHLAVSYDGVTIRIYKNGIEVASQAHSVGGNLDLGTGVDTLIGFNTGGDSGDYFDGIIDDVRIYESALFAIDIQTIMVDGTIPTVACTDSDSDGYVVEGGSCDTSGIVPFYGYDDCADGNINVFPGQTEDCGNGIDDDCDINYDYGVYGVRLGDDECLVTLTDIFVNDSTPFVGNRIHVTCTADVFSEGSEAFIEGVGPCNYAAGTCGGADSSCEFNCNNIGSAGIRDAVCYIDGTVDHQFGPNLTSSITVSDVVSCTDVDGDGWVAESLASGCDTSGIVSFNGYDDCNDIVGTTYPGATESCDNVDNDCSAGTLDGSSEGWYGNITSCGVGVCVNSGILDCIAGSQEDTCVVLPPQEIGDFSCDNLDNNCDGFTDEDYIIDSSCFLPGECAAGNVASSCNVGIETVCSTGTPLTETCNGLDDDCTGVDDDNLIEPLNTLQDGVCVGSVQACNGVLGWFDDYSSVINYEATELTCNDVLNNDCDLTTDCGDSDCSADASCIVMTYPDSYILDLTTGWNYVSVPLRGLLENGVSKFNSDIVLEYNDGWDINYKDILSEVGVIEPLKGYIVYSTSDQSILFNGTLNESYVSPLGVDNWNLVGTSIVGYDFDLNQLFNETSPILPGSVVLGNAYWVYTGSEPQLAPPSTGFWNFLFGLFKY